MNFNKNELNNSMIFWKMISSDFHFFLITLSKSMQARKKKNYPEIFKIC